MSTGSGPYVTASRSVRGRLTGVPVSARSRRTLPHRLSAANPAATRRDASECTVLTLTPISLAAG
ncbi:MAG: hypothetical protein ACYCPF_03715 [Streptosporangiaceae bacterium]